MLMQLSFLYSVPMFQLVPVAWRIRNCLLSYLRHPFHLFDHLDARLLDRPCFIDLHRHVNHDADHGSHRSPVLFVYVGDLVLHFHDLFCYTFGGLNRLRHIFDEGFVHPYILFDYVGDLLHPRSSLSDGLVDRFVDL